MLIDVRAKSVTDTTPSVSAPEETQPSQPASSASPSRAREDTHRSTSPPSGVGTAFERDTSSAEAEEDGNEEEKIPWSSSPPQHFLGPQQREETQVKAVNDSSCQSPEQRGPRSTGNVSIRYASLPDTLPDNIITSDPGLEIEVPHAVPEALEPVNRQPVVVFSHTPPSQQVIPCTLTERASPVQEPQPKRRRLMKPVMIDSPKNLPHRGGDSRPTLPGSGSPPPAQPSSPAINLSSTPMRQGSTRATSPVTPSVTNQHDRTCVDRSGVVAATSALQSAGDHVSGEFPVNGPPDTSSQPPYATFKTTYPDYKGTLGDFLRALLSILPLQKKRALAEFLYDDFVRVFSTDFLTYISDQEGNPHPLTAVEFYNENVSKPVYLGGVLTKDNLRKILGRYSDEIRAILGVTFEPEETIAATRERHDQRAPDSVSSETQAAQQPPDRAETSHASRESSPPSAAVPASPELGTSETQSSAEPAFAAAELHPVKQVLEPVPPSTANIDVSQPSPTVRPLPEACRTANKAVVSPSQPAFQTQFQSPSLDIEPSPTPVTPAIRKRTLPAVDKFSGLGLSQASNPESIADFTLKRRAAPRASAGSSTTEPAAAFRRPQAAGTNADKRALRFKKFLMQKKIQSSVPEQSTP